jgi:hypothetical protein
MLPSSQHADGPHPGPLSKIDFRLAASVLLLATAAVFTRLTIDGLASRRGLRMELAEINHVRYGLLNADRWMEQLLPILNTKIDGLDLKGPAQTRLKPAIENALYRLLIDVKEKMTTKDPQSNAVGGLLGQANSLMVNLIIEGLRPHVPEYADLFLAELGKPETKDAFKQYVKSVLAEGAASTFGSVDMTWYSDIVKHHGCADAIGCQEELGRRIHEADAKITYYYLAVLASCAGAFLLLMIGRPILRRSSTAVLLLFCVVLLAGGVLTPMIEVEAKITQLHMTFLGQPVAFTEQVLYFQSKSVLEVFHTLISMGRPDMWFVGVLVLMFSIIFPTLKVFTLAFCLYKPSWLRKNRVVRFLALESSKWSMADVMALAIFMSFVAFNGLIMNTMTGLKATGAELAIPTDSSKILPGYQLFIGFCLASLFLSKKLERGIQTGRVAEPG